MPCCRRRFRYAFDAATRYYFADAAADFLRRAIFRC